MPQIWDVGGSIGVPDLLALRQQATVRKARQSLADLAPGPDGSPNYGQGANQLLSAGDLEGARSLASLGESKEARLFREQQAKSAQANSDRSFAFQEAQAGRAQGNADRSYALSERTAASKGFDVRPIKNADGSTSLVRIDLSNGTTQPIDGTTGAVGGPGGGVNPYYTGKFNAEQGKAATYADRMAASHKIISGLENINDGVGGKVSGIAATLAPDIVTNQFAGADRQKSIQAQRDFLNAILRRESGAAISSSEFSNGRSQYFPQPGDGPEVLAQKRANRETAMAGIMREAGSAYQPPAGFTGPGHMGDGQGATQPQAKAAAPPVQGAKQAPDGNWYLPDPNRPGKFLQVQP